MATLERRKFIRFDTALDASYEILGGTAKGPSVVKNLSREGAQIVADTEFGTGTEVGLHLNVPGDNVPIFACAEVAWNKKTDSQGKAGFATGMKFTKIDRYDKARLLDYVYSQWLKFLKKEA